jgi:hypothetical protein
MQHVMRVCVLLLALALTAVYVACSRVMPDTAAPALYGMSAHNPSKPDPSETPQPRVDFDTQIRPILQTRCTPCHFEGGTMYKRLPFDRAETIKTLGTKLFTRIKDEKEQRLIRDFLTQQAEPNH